MELKYNFYIKDEAVQSSFTKFTNQIYKLLPMREEGDNWQKPLETILEELSGLDRMLVDQHSILLPLICKLEGLFTLTDKEDFMLYRRIIFECLNLLSDIERLCLNQKI